MRNQIFEEVIIIHLLLDSKVYNLFMAENQDSSQSATPLQNQNEKSGTTKKKGAGRTTAIKDIVTTFIPATVPIAAEITVNNIINSAETGREGNIHFEPGIHPTIGIQVDALYSGYNAGENTHAWNSEVGERVSHYAPEVLAIDGFNPITQGKDETDKEYKERVEYYKGFVWLILPERVSKINPSGSIFVVAGDLGSSLARKIDNEELGWDIYEKSDYPNAARVLPTIAEGYLKYALGYIVGIKIFEQLNVINKTPYTRRGFLRLLINATATAGIAAGGSSFLTSISPNNDLEAVLRSINQ